MKIEYEDAPKGSQDKGTFKTVSDEEHANMIKTYLEGASMADIALQFKRSPRTIQLHIQWHNDAVAKVGYCGPCKRLGSVYAVTKAERGITKN